MPLTPHSAEVAYLKRLIEDFPSEVSPEEAEKAHQKIASRYSALEQSYRQLAKQYQELNSDLPVRLKQLAYAIHAFLFDGPNNSKFISKLNACHKRMESGYTFDRYFAYILSFFRKYVMSIDELSDFE